MTTLYIDNQVYTAETHGRNLLEVCLSLGLNVPYFCWHPAFRSIGACRQCAVKVYKDEHDLRGRIEMSCMIPATEGMRVSIDDPEAVAFRRHVIEWLMVNHPHDCPVCDEGGECHLQDMTVMTGHTYRRYRFSKRTHRNQDLGPFVNMEMNRCIQCYRCVRFYRDYAGGRDFDVLGWHDDVYFGRHQDGALESEFSGNLVEVCPTGVFTDKSLKRHYTRKWDLQTAPSICPHCSLGCNTLPGARDGLLRRIMPRYNGAVNGAFLCDRGRYGYEYVNHARRIRTPLRRNGAAQGAMPSATAWRAVADMLQSGSALGIGSPRASVESNFALRALVGEAQFYHGVSARELRLTRTMLGLLQQGPARTPALHDVEACDAVLVLGEDVTNTAPMLDLALRQAVLQQPRAAAVKLGIYEWLDACLREAMQDAHGPLFVATPAPTKLDGLATAVNRAAPQDIARLGFAVAQALDPAAPDVTDLDPAFAARAQQIAAALKAARHPLVVSGAGCASEEVVQSAAAVAAALCRAGVAAQLCLVPPESNSFGAALMPGDGLEDALVQVRAGAVKTLVILENDLFRRLEAASAAALLDGVAHVIVLDQLETPTTARAEIVLPAAASAEASGTLINNEGRAQRFFQVLVPPADTRASWRWIGEVMAAMSCSAASESPGTRGSAAAGERDAPPCRWSCLDALLKELASALPLFAALPTLAPAADFRMVDGRIPRQPARYSGRTSLTVNRDVHEPKPPDDPDSPLTFSMEGSSGAPPPALLPRYWAPQWNSVQALSKFQAEVGGPLQGGDPGQRLIEPAAGLVNAGSCAERPGQPHLHPQPTIPPSFAARPGSWLLLPAWHIYGSDELSVLSPGVAARAPQPYVALNPDDMRAAGLREGQAVTLAFDGQPQRLPVRACPGLVAGLALVPAGLPDLPCLAWPAWITITREGRP